MANRLPPRIPPLLAPEWDAVTFEAASVFPATRDFVLSHDGTNDSRGVCGRISWLRHSEYEFVQHLGLGRLAGLRDAHVERIQLGLDAAEYE